MATRTQMVSMQLFATISRLNQNVDFVGMASAKTILIFLPSSKISWHLFQVIRKAKEFLAW